MSKRKSVDIIQILSDFSEDECFEVDCTRSVVSSKEPESKKMAKKFKVKNTLTPSSPLDATPDIADMEDKKETFRKFANDTVNIFQTQINKSNKTALDLMESNFANCEKAFQLIENKKDQLFENLEKNFQDVRQAVLDTNRSINNLAENTMSMLETLCSKSDMEEEVMKNVEKAMTSSKKKYTELYKHLDLQ